MKKKLILLSCYLSIALIFGASVAGPQAAERQKVFALVPKLVGVSFYTDVERGCTDEARTLAVKCLFVGPPTADAVAQEAIIGDLIARGVDGLAIAPNDPQTVGSIITQARAKGIPVITFDSDAPDTSRSSFIGTNNFQGGVEGGKAFRAAAPGGGAYAILTGGISADNLNARIKGFRSALGDSFHELDGSPFPCDDNPAVGTRIVLDILAKNPDIKGLFYSGGWPMFAPDNYAAAMEPYRNAIVSGRLVIVSFDAVDAQIKLLKAGLATALIGQNPYRMGTSSVEILNDLAAGHNAPTLVDTGVTVIDAKLLNQ